MKRRARQELWELACALGPRRQSQLRLLAVQASRAARPPKRAARHPQRARRWWAFELDYAHPRVLPEQARAGCGAALLAAVAGLCLRLSGMPGAQT